MRKHWLLSRKFWLSVVSAAVIMLREQFGLELDTEHVLGIVLAVAAYVAGESYIDASK